MRHISLTTALVLAAALPAGCDSDDDDDGAGEPGPGPNAAGSGGEAGQGGIFGLGPGGAGGAGAAISCDHVFVPNTCRGQHQVVLPTELPDGGSSTPCTVALEFTVEVPQEVYVAVDCVVIQRDDPDAAGDGEFWQYDNAEQPAAILFSDALCTRLEQDGFSRIDIMEGCTPLEVYPP